MVIFLYEIQDQLNYKNIALISVLPVKQMSSSHFEQIKNISFSELILIYFKLALGELNIHNEKCTFNKTYSSSKLHSKKK